MTATPVTIVCANCGAKYKLPSDFKSASAKCKGCGAVIDVAGQMRAAAAPAAAPPAASKSTARPSAGRAAAAAKKVERPSSAARGRSGSRRDGAATDDHAGGRRGRAAPAAKSGGNKLVLVGSLVAIVALGVVGYFVFTGLNKPTEPEPQAASAAADKNAADASMKKTDVADNAKSEADAAADALKAMAGGNPAEGAGNDAKAEEKADATPPEAKKPAAKKADKAKEPANTEKAVITAADVFNPLTLDPLQYPEDVDEATRKEVDSLCEDLRNGGRAGINAKKRLEEIGHPAIVGVVNLYRTIDFKDPNQAMFAFEMNKFLTNAFGAGLISANFKPTQQGEPIPPDVADFNGKTVSAWQRFWQKNSDKAAWEQFVKNRKEGKKLGETSEGDK